MILGSEWEAARDWAWRTVRACGVPVRDEERGQIEIADLGFGDLAATGLQILTLANTGWISAKLLILRPNQFFPQHRHPPAPDEGYPGKEEIFRGQWGEAYLYLPGEPTAAPRAEPPAARRPYCSVWNEIVLRPGDQAICPPNTWHWFQGGPEGAVLWSLSSRVTDAQDQFSDPAAVRQTVIVEDARDPMPPPSGSRP